MNLFYTAEDVHSLLGLNTRKVAYDRIRKMNDELKSKGYWVEPGKIPKKLFHEKYPYIDPID